MDTFGDTSAKKMPDHLFYGASHVDYESAIKADVSQQNAATCPRHWYADATIKCELCNVNFLFSKEEQKYWYETLKFWVDSFPKKCSECKKKEKEFHQEFNYVKTQFYIPGKEKKVLETLEVIRERFGFIPWNLREIKEKIERNLNKK